MLRDEGVEIEATWTGTNAGVARHAGGKQHEQIDRELRRIAKRKAGLDVEEARWLREAERHRIWRTLGYSTAFEYLEDVFGYAPRTAKDRLRVAKELGELPELEAEVGNGALPYSAARELTRVMTRANQAQWLARARGKSVGDIQRLVAGHKKGDTPDDPKDPAQMTRSVVFELDTRRQALLQQVRAILEAERGEYLEDADLLEAMCMCVLAGGDASEREAERTGAPASGEPERNKGPRPAHQIVIRRCDDCGRVWQQGRGAFIEITAFDRELAECDAEIVREPDLVAAEASGTRRPTPTLSIPKKTRDLVMARDQGRCRFPGCRATRHVAIHHIEHRAHGGGHDPWNLVALCDGHHKLLHAGLVSVTGRAPDQLVFMRGGTRLVDARAPAELEAGAELRAQCSAGAASSATVPRAGSTRSRFDEVVEIEHATQALKQLGFKTRAAKQALERARAHVGTDADIPTLVKTVLALQRGGELEPREPEPVVQAKQALVQMGFSPSLAEQAVAAACARVGTDVGLTALIKEALRRCC